MTCSVNGEQRMRVNTADQIWKLPDILEHFSRYIPIEPGDMFSTGAPGGVAVGKPNAAELFLKPGDVVECGIEGIATLRTTIVAPPPRKAPSLREPRRPSRRRSATLGRRRLVGAELDDVARRRRRRDAQQMALHRRADVHLQLAVADRAGHARVGLQLEPVLDVEVADRPCR